MPKYTVQYTIHSGMAIDDYVSSGECEIDAATPEEAKTKAKELAENNDSHFDPRIDPFIVIQDDWIEELPDGFDFEQVTLGDED